VPKTPGKGYFALVKAFAGCSTRQRAAGKKSAGKDFFAGCFLSSTRQRLCRVQTRYPAKKSGRHGACSVSPWFAGCHVRGTRQIFFLIFFLIFLCRVRCRKDTRQRFFIFFIISLPGVAPGAPGKEFLFFL
jgi:hypothetical protein